MSVSKFDVPKNSENGATIVLTDQSEGDFSTPIPRRTANFGGTTRTEDEIDSPQGITFGGTAIPRQQTPQHESNPKQGALFQDTPVPAFGLPASFLDPTVPKPIRDMLALYHHGTGSQQERAQNFVTQAKFMEYYTDDVPWQSNFKRFLPTYHDLNVTQLRGYFSWRTRIRKGEAVRAPLSFAYLHVYELLNGVGAASAEEVLEKIKVTASICKEAGMADAQFDANISNWLLCFAVLHNVPAERAQQYVDSAILNNDKALITLQNPEQYSDADVCEALKFFASEQFHTSPTFTKNEEESRRLFAAIWRFANAHYSASRNVENSAVGSSNRDAENSAVLSAIQGGFQENRRVNSQENSQNNSQYNSNNTPNATYGEKRTTLFTRIFGKAQQYKWYPLHNAIYVQDEPHENTTYQLTECRSFTCTDGSWTQSKFNKLYFYETVLHQLLHEADRQVRERLKTGHYLRFKADEAWARELVEDAFVHLERARQEASRVRVQLDIRNLNAIRADAASTRESLLTEEEKGEPAKSTFTQERLTTKELFIAEKTRVAEEPSAVEKTLNTAKHLANPNQHVPVYADTRGHSTAEHGKQASEQNTQATKQSKQTSNRSESYETAVLRMLTQGKPVSDYLREHHLMASVVADAINEKYYDEIGDSIVEYDGSELTLVEDYVEDVMQLIQ